MSMHAPHSRQGWIEIIGNSEGAIYAENRVVAGDAATRNPDADGRRSGWEVPSGARQLATLHWSQSDMVWVALVRVRPRGCIFERHADAVPPLPAPLGRHRKHVQSSADLNYGGGELGKLGRYRWKTKPQKRIARGQRLSTQRFGERLRRRNKFYDPRKSWV